MTSERSEASRKRDPAVTSRIMAAVKSKNTRPEMLLRRQLHALGLRYRVHPSLPGRPDIAFTRAHLAVFVDGDFWHGHGWRDRGFDSLESQFAGHRDPHTWITKIRRNIERDGEVNRALERAGWKVHRVPASRVITDPTRAAAEVAAAYEQARGHQAAKSSDRATLLDHDFGGAKRSSLELRSANPWLGGAVEPAAPNDPSQRQAPAEH